MLSPRHHLYLVSGKTIFALSSRRIAFVQTEVPTLAPVPISESGQRDREQPCLEHSPGLALTSWSGTESPAIPQDSWVESELRPAAKATARELNGARTWKSQKLGDGSDCENSCSSSYLHVCDLGQVAAPLSLSFPIMTRGHEYLCH